MENIEYTCNLCGKPLTRDGHDTSLHRWSHLSYGEYEECRNAWLSERGFTANNDLAVGYWLASYYGIKVKDSPKISGSPLNSEIRDIVIWKK